MGDFSFSVENPLKGNKKTAISAICLIMFFEIIVFYKKYKICFLFSLGKCTFSNRFLEIFLFLF
ncbi:Hypothetical protein Ccan_01830 [Capnocytophaga canimorsus Cc5]|uniref:Uncharacterized protein n=1 Tax=Capnocytophaga canimorsus (strain 5) TaxID=860228 RepID=F9YQD7_CAPCC|nr:Hypothetical protein Ccan_01830 [Capnocytophaga canimorsus Cc5]